MKNKHFIYVIILMFFLTGCSTLKSRTNAINIEFINTTPARIILDDKTKTKFTYILSDIEISKKQLEFELGVARYIDLESHLIEPYKNLGAAYKIKDYKIEDVIVIEVNNKLLKAFKEKSKAAEPNEYIANSGKNIKDYKAKDDLQDYVYVKKKNLPQGAKVIDEKMMTFGEFEKQKMSQGRLEFISLDRMVWVNKTFYPSYQTKVGIMKNVEVTTVWDAETGDKIGAEYNTVSTN